jgi:hypothetical protein
MSWLTRRFHLIHTHCGERMAISPIVQPKDIAGRSSQKSKSAGQMIRGRHCHALHKLEPGAAWVQCHPSQSELRNGSNRNRIGKDQLTYKRRGRHSLEPPFPYGKSVIASSALLLASMLALALLSDPQTGQIRTPYLAWLTVAALPIAIGVAFFAECRWRSKHFLSGGERAHREPRILSRKRSPKKDCISVKC